MVNTFQAELTFLIKQRENIDNTFSNEEIENEIAKFKYPIAIIPFEAFETDFKNYSMQNNRNYCINLVRALLGQYYDEVELHIISFYATLRAYKNQVLTNDLLNELKSLIEYGTDKIDIQYIIIELKQILLYHYVYSPVQYDIQVAEVILQELKAIANDHNTFNLRERV